jgi:hypothetical protein
VSLRKPARIVVGIQLHERRSTLGVPEYQEIGCPQRQPDLSPAAWSACANKVRPLAFTSASSRLIGHGRDEDFSSPPVMRAQLRAGSCRAATLSGVHALDRSGPGTASLFFGVVFSVRRAGNSCSNAQGNPSEAPYAGLAIGDVAAFLPSRNTAPLFRLRHKALGRGREASELNRLGVAAESASPAPI